VTDRLPLLAEAIPLADVDGDLLRAWRELADEAAEPNPFFVPEMLLPAARLLPGGADVRLHVVRSGERLDLAVPLIPARYRRMPVPALSTWRHPYRYVGTPLVRTSALDSAPGALLRALAEGETSGWLAFEQMYVDGVVAEAFRTAAEQRSARWVEHDVWRRPAVLRREAETYLDDTLTSRSAKTLRRQRRHLERDLGPVDVRDVARMGGAAAVRAEVDAFLAMEAAGWKGRAGTAAANDPAHAAFWREACQAMAEAGRLELWQLRAGDVVAARQCHVRMGGTVFHLRITYDESLGKSSPGVQLEVEVVHAFHADRQVDLIDPCTEREPGTSSRFYPDSRRIGDVLIGLSTVGRLLADVTPLASRAWRAVRRHDAPAAVSAGE
jgi:CelD/BcsL family acetyltransferase involved in cellulose biosynthesis